MISIKEEIDVIFDELYNNENYYIYYVNDQAVEKLIDEIENISDLINSEIYNRDFCKECTSNIIKIQNKAMDVVKLAFDCKKLIKSKKENEFINVKELYEFVKSNDYNNLKLTIIEAINVCKVLLGKDIQLKK